MSRHQLPWILFGTSLIVTGYLLVTCHTGPIRSPSPEQLTKFRISKLELLFYDYRDKTGAFPREAQWSKSIVVTLSGDKDLVDTDIREGIELFFDGWGQPMRYRCPGKHNVGTFDLYSIGPNSVDEGGGNDDIGNWQLK
jgi:hypothetical protein